MHEHHQQDPESIAPQPSATRVGTRVSRWQVTAVSLLLGLALTSLQLLMVPTARAQDETVIQGSGFLSNYSNLRQDPKNPDLLIYWRNPDVLKDTNKFILAPVVVYLIPSAQQAPIDPAQLAKATDYFTNAITEQLTAGNYEIVTTPAPGVMVLKLAITNLQPTSSGKNATVAGAATVASMAVAPGAALLVPRVSVGKVSIEGELVDSMSGRVEVSFMTSKSGRKMFSGLKAYQSWGDINAAFNAWAKGFRMRLDTAHNSY
jgi:hypothetical protein